MGSKNTETKSEQPAAMWETQKYLIESLRDSYFERKETGEATEFDRHLVEGMQAMLEGKFDKSYHALEMMVREVLDPYVITVLDIDEARGVYHRVHSSHPDRFPVTEDLPLPTEGHWAEFIKRRQTMYSNSMSRVTAHFPDGAECLAMGCLSFCYMPIHEGVEDGEILGILALYAKVGFFDEENTKALAGRELFFFVYFFALKQALKNVTPAS